MTNKISDIALFKCLPAEAAAQYERSITWRRYDANELIIDFEEHSTDVRFILAGRLRVLIRTESGKEVILDELSGGAYFGEMAAIDGKGRSANVTALERALVGVMPAEVFMTAATAHPEIAGAVMRGLVDRIRDLNLKLAEQHFLTAGQRLCAELLRLSKPRTGDAGQRIISPPPMQQDIANRIGSSREAVSRQLSVLEKDGVIEKTRGGLVLKDIAAIHQRIGTALPH